MTIRGELVQRLISRQEITKQIIPTTPDELGTFVNHLLADILDKDELLRKLAPGLSLAAVAGNVLFIKDAKKGTAEVFLKDSTLFCEMDKKLDCEHVRFAMAVPEIAHLNLKKPKD